MESVMDRPKTTSGGTKSPALNSPSLPKSVEPHKQPEGAPIQAGDSLDPSLLSPGWPSMTDVGSTPTTPSPRHVAAPVPDTGRAPRHPVQARAKTTADSRSQPVNVSREAAMANAEAEGNMIREVLFAASMASAIPFSELVSPAGYKAYIDRFVAEAGDPDDPIERLMVQQILLAHHRIAQLHVQAAAARTPDEAKAYGAVAVRLTSEFRRLCLSLQEYRQPAPPK